jgi:endogenous inhibitor of DNA gyrase (YacG/DUF329 family)
MTYINCPKCNDQSYFNLSSYSGPYRCMKCKEVFTIVIDGGEVKSSQLAKQDPDKLKLIKTYYTGDNTNQNKRY